jgi:hypothetical protein
MEAVMLRSLAVEGHHAECNETAINALKADIQAMNESEAKTTATKEMEAAQEMMAKKRANMRRCAVGVILRPA